jgi:hypothetical protein
MSLYVAAPSAELRTIDVFRADPAAPLWSESSVTWAGQPAVVAGAASSGQPADPGWQEWTVTGLVQDLYASPRNNGFLLRDQAENATAGVGQDYDSHDTGGAMSNVATRPTLVVTWGGTASSCSVSGAVTSLPAADAWITDALPNSNYGSDPVLPVRSRATENSRALIRFDLPPLPAGCSVTRAVLGLYNSSTMAGRTIDLYRAGAAWSSPTVTWNTGPATAGTAVSRVTGSSNGWQAWPVTDHVLAQYAGPNDGFVLRDSVDNDPANAEQRYHSSEAAAGPRLVVTWG